MVSVADAIGRRTGLHAVVSALVLIPVSLLPALIGRSSPVCGVVAAILSLIFFGFAVRFARHPSRPTARALFLVSIAYLPLVLLALAVDAAWRA
jgi:protoheme IX farnesyltransferase